MKTILRYLLAFVLVILLLIGGGIVIGIVALYLSIPRLLGHDHPYYTGVLMLSPVVIFMTVAIASAIKEG